MMKKIILIDGNSLINRAFYGLPLLTNSSGEYCNAIFGFCNILIKLIAEQQPEYIAIAFDAGKHTFRHDIYAQYKGTRKGMPAELAEQLPNLKKVLKAMNIFIIEKAEIEADDLIGSLSKKFDIDTIIVSGDKDLLQLIDNSTEVWLTKKGISDIVRMNEQTLQETMGLKPYQIVELKSLMGDASDNIPGVMGVGEKTALSLINTYDNLDNLYAHILEINGKLYEKLSDNKATAYISKKLATINTKVPLDVELNDLKYDFPFDNNVLELFKHFEFNSLVRKKNLFDEELVKTTQKKVIHTVIDNISQLELLKDEMKKSNLMSLYINNTDIHIALSKYKEYQISCEERSLISQFGITEVLTEIKSFLEDSQMQKICLDTKALKHFLANYNIRLNGVIFDVSLAQYLLSGSKKSSGDIGSYLSALSYEDYAIGSCLIASYFEYAESLKREEMFNLYYNVEFPLIDVLFDMEQNGFKVDKKILNTLNECYTEELKNLTKEIYGLAGSEFNINSPKQLADILFNRLLLPGGKKKSTSVDILEKLEGAHPIIAKILRYRKVFKFNSTYLEGFKNLIDEKTGLIHTIFNQTLTSTGRLSSSEPNLQNIPIRDEEGKLLRKMFIPRETDGILITADYSQIELRILAHYTQDERLVSAYKANMDIHKKTASDIFNLPIEEITGEMRRTAKTVNFGIIYGISDFGLSENLKISRKQAAEYMKKYFETYTSVKEYMKRSVDTVREKGYAVSIMGRKRRIDEINSSDYLTRQFGERASINMPLQGSASDIIKLAMVNVNRAMKEKKLKSKLILQIHDELIIDAVKEEKVEIIKILTEEMENAVELKVPLVVDINYGSNWYEA